MTFLFSETENTTNEFSFKQLEANLQPKNIYKNDISHERKLNAELRWISKEEEIQAYHQKQNAAPQEHNIILGITSGYSLVIIDGRGQQSKGGIIISPLSGVVALNGMNRQLTLGDASEIGGFIRIRKESSRILQRRNDWQ